MHERRIEWPFAKRRIGDILWRVSIVILGAALFFLANGAAAGDGEPDGSASDTDRDDLCGSLSRLLEAGPGFQSIRGETLEANRWSATQSLPGSAGCHITTSLSGQADVACLMYKALDRPPVEARYETTLKSVRACLAGWNEVDATNPIDVRAVELSRSGTATRVRVRLVNATVAHRLVINISS